MNMTLQQRMLFLATRNGRPLEKPGAEKEQNAYSNWMNVDRLTAEVFVAAHLFI
jgi:hypothetical protein